MSANDVMDGAGIHQVSMSLGSIYDHTILQCVDMLHNDYYKS